MKRCVTVIFSRNRALQCHLLLSTLFNHCKDIEQESNIFVLHRNDSEHEKSYETLKTEFPTVNFVKETNFKQDLLKLLLSNESNISWGKNVCFLTDDSVICNDFNMTNVIKTLENSRDCLGFSLRLGLNTKFCYPYNCEQAVPHVINVNKNVLMFDWQKAEYDFGYPIELSSSVYPLENIIEILQNCQYFSPNSLESCMAGCYIEDKPNLLMFPKSVCFSSPLNIVQDTHKNRNAGHDPDTFRRLYEKGIRFNATQFDNITPNAAHWIPENFEVININEGA
jgi:hypothetical protein